MTDILFVDAFENMGKSDKNLKRVDFPLIRFGGRTTYPLGAITLPVVFGERRKSIKVTVNFVVVDARTSYNSNIGMNQEAAPARRNQTGALAIETEVDPREEKARHAPVEDLGEVDVGRQI